MSDLVGAFAVALVLVGVSVPLLGRATRRDAVPLTGLLMAALVLKLAGAVARYGVAFEVYQGVADAGAYHRAGTVLARSFRAGHFDVDVASVPGTGFVEVVTGLVYAVVGANRLAGFFVFSWLGFWGLFLFYRAFRLACPTGDHRRYALLVFLLPSLLFWPSSIGKEAWMTFTLGLTAFGVARILARAKGGFFVLGLGLAGTALVRPHVTLIVLPGLLVAYLLRRPSARPSALGPLAKVAGVTVLLAASLVVVGQAERFLGIDRFDRQSVDATINTAAAQTAQGGSSFRPTRPTSPAQVPAAVVTVMFRPFPHEAGNLQGRLAGLEGLFLMALFVVSWRRVLSAFRSVARTPYVAFVLVYFALFVYAFSAFANFGILTRERVQLFPLALVLLALPVAARPERRRGWQAEPWPKAATPRAATPEPVG